MNNTDCRYDRGNVLFLILIAVALFAALSYAVTQSSRGGGGDISEETAALNAARIIQEATLMQQTIMRLKLSDGYQQVFFNDSAPTSSGTCYDLGNAITPCKTIGIFHPSTGVKHNYTRKFYSPYDDYLEYYVGGVNHRALIKGVEAGTEKADELLYISLIDPETCKQINKKLHNYDGMYPKFDQDSGPGYYVTETAFEPSPASSSVYTGSATSDYEHSMYCAGDADGAELEFLYEQN